MNTNNVNKTCAVLQTTGGKDESNIFILWGNCNGHHLSSYSKIIVRDTSIYLQHFPHIRGHTLVAKHVSEHTSCLDALNLVHAISSRFSHTSGSAVMLIWLTTIINLTRHHTCGKWAVMYLWIMDTGFGSFFRR